MKKLLLRAAVASLLVLSAGLAGAAVMVSLTPTADAFVTNGSSNSGNNYGGAGALGVSAAGLPAGEFQSVLRFDLSPAKAFFDITYGVGLWTLAQAQLKLTATPPNNAIFNGFSTTSNTAGLFNIEWMSDDSWVEGTGTPGTPTTNGVTYTTLPGFLGTVESLNPGGTPFSFNGSTSSATTYNLELGTNFLNDVNSGSVTSLHLSAADSSIAALWNSRSVGTAANRPTLTLAVPEPGRTTLLGLALGLALLRRKRD